MRLISKLLLAFFVITTGTIHADSPFWELARGWNTENVVKLYFHYSEMQRQWVWELMGKQRFRGDEHILDFGCGDGKISAELSRFVPQGKIDAFDVSPQMITFAKIKFPAYAYPNLKFNKSDSFTFDDIPGTNAYDIITAFCVFHMVKEPLEILKNLKTHLKPSGKMFLVIPAGRNPIFFRAGNDMFEKYQLEAPWRNQSTANIPTMRTLEGCAMYLKEAGFQITTMEMIDTDNPYYDKNELLEWMVGTVSANWNIPLETAPFFFYDVIERMAELDPDLIDAEGRIHFKAGRILVVATQITN